MATTITKHPVHGLKLIAAVLMLGTLLVLLPATAADAHPTSIRHGADIARVTNRHHTITWCDREADRHRVYAQYRVKNSWVATPYDPNGSRPGCGRITINRPI